MSTQQPEALNLEEFRAKVTRAARDPLLARIAELESQLSAIGAGGVEPLRKQAAAPQAVPASVIAGAVFDFAGYLTTLPHKEAIHCSEAHEAAPMVEAITEWCKRRNLTTDGAKVETWRDHLAEAPAHPAEGVPVQAVELDVDDLIDRLLDAQQDLNLAANVHMDQSIASASTLLDEVEIALRTLAATQPAAQGLDAQTTRDAVIQHLTNAGVLEHDGCGIFIASGDASELIDACMALSTHAHHEKGAAAQAAALLATGGQAQAVKLLAADHSGMKVDYRGLFSQVQRALKRTDPGYAEMLRQLESHLQELGQRWYAGDTDVVDEILQLYCIERYARKTLGTSATAAAQAKKGEQSNG